ncbi:hypothetical protein [Microcoleus sp. B3-D7]|uniref:hypothetical protein n=1 Tax=Microcoleus sp. B3-D7 TaxID=2818659 RepID=UPI002FCE796B
MTNDDLSLLSKTKQAEKIARFFNTFDVLRQEHKELLGTPPEAFSKENWITFHLLNKFFIDEFLFKAKEEMNEEIMKIEQKLIEETGSLPVGPQKIVSKDGSTTYFFTPRTKQPKQRNTENPKPRPTHS